MQCKRPLKRPVSNGHDNVVNWGFLENAMDFVGREPGQVFSIDLQNLVSKSKNTEHIKVNYFNLKLIPT